MDDNILQVQISEHSIRIKNMETKVEEITMSLPSLTQCVDNTKKNVEKLQSTDKKHEEKINKMGIKVASYEGQMRWVTKLIYGLIGVGLANFITLIFK